MILKWLFKEAKWWQFWLPQSGFIGGTITGAILLLIIIYFTHVH